MKEAVIVSAVRTAVGKAPKGTLRDTRPDEMGAAVIKEAIAKAGYSLGSDISLALDCAGTGENRFEQGRLARAIRPHYGVHFSDVHPKGDSSEYFTIADAGVQIIYF